jgi:DUF2971 family protein
MSTVPTASNVPDVVYHYTSMQALRDIVESRSIWATNIRYLNDVLERQHYLSLIKSYVDSMNPRSKLYEQLLQRILEDEAEHTPFYALPFVASFSYERDSLPQWRSYCPHGNGVSIGFRTDSLRAAFVKHRSKASDSPHSNDVESDWLSPQVTFDPVRYPNQNNMNEIVELFQQAVKEAEAWEGANEDGEDPASMDSVDFLWYALDKHASRTKHHSFESEREYRLIVTNPNFLDVFGFRPSRSTLIPYISLSLENPKRSLERKITEGHLIYFERRIRDTPLTPFFIDSVTIGPTPHPDLSADAVRGMFWQLGAEVFVDKSIVPFRDW